MGFLRKTDTVVLLILKALRVGVRIQSIRCREDLGFDDEFGIENKGVMRMCIVTIQADPNPRPQSIVLGNTCANFTLACMRAAQVNVPVLMLPIVPNTLVFSYWINADTVYPKADVTSSIKYN
jgi:hypothetical protein